MRAGREEAGKTGVYGAWDGVEWATPLRRKGLSRPHEGADVKKDWVGFVRRVAWRIRLSALSRGWDGWK